MKLIVFLTFFISSMLGFSQEKTVLYFSSCHIYYSNDREKTDSTNGEIIISDTLILIDDFISQPARKSIYRIVSVNIEGSIYNYTAEREMVLVPEDGIDMSADYEIITVTFSVIYDKAQNLFSVVQKDKPEAWREEFVLTNS